MSGLRLAGVVALLVGSAATDCALATAPDFAKDVLPILRRTCFECHGPKVQEADLRLDQREAVLEDSGVVVPGEAENSELYRRIVLPAGHEEVMPAVGRPLAKKETELVRRWIEAGAEWPENLDVGKHWAYVAPVRPELPKVSDPSWPRNEVDHFVLARLDYEGLKPSPEASRAALLRRVHFDLTGLPPSPEEAAEFLADESDDAYEKAVDRLLESPQFGERWARPWLDLARYADSHGFQRDDLREIWAYRDWVIKALNADMPFDEFTITQLAGDLLPAASDDQKIATGFNRCTMTNVEAGTDPEETRTNQVMDRVNTMSTVWLGSTLECAQCHDHKYDPFTQKEYYQLFAFFNNTVLEADRTNRNAPGSIQFLGPLMNLPDVVADRKRQKIEAELAAIDAQIESRNEELHNDAQHWEVALRQSLEKRSQSHVLQLLDFESAEGAAHRQLEDNSVLLSEDPTDVDTYTFEAETDVREITGFRLEALTDKSLPGGGPGRADGRRPNFVLNTITIEAAPRGSDEFKPVRLVKAVADYSQRRFAVAKAIDSDPKTGWAIGPQFFAPHWAQFQTDAPIGFAEGTRLRFRLVQESGAGRTIGRLRMSAMTGDLGDEAVPNEVAQLLHKEATQRTAREQQSLLKYRQSKDESIAELRKERSAVEAKLREITRHTTLVMQELPKDRPTMVFARGDFKQPAERVEPGVPAALHSIQPGQGDRMALAKWLVDRRNPLVARVTVNRWWAEMFGHGIVETVEDFGIKGQPPTHPKLLDWLALEFMSPTRGEPGWSMKHVLRTIVTSATYRQSSKVTPELLACDDQNKLYARGPRVRLDAETVRDNALAVAGLLSKKQFGPPIRPYQPEGVWTKVGGQRVEYVVSPGEDKYRRGIYVVIKRGSPYPSFVNFDGSARLACTTKRSRSNTPLQALTLLNDPVYVEAAKGLAVRTLRETPEANIEQRVEHMVRICLSRELSALERSVLTRLYEEQLRSASSVPAATKELVADVKLPKGIQRPELAAWYAVATALLNLDETITKG